MCPGKASLPGDPDQLREGDMQAGGALQAEGTAVVRVGGEELSFQKQLAAIQLKQRERGRQGWQLKSERQVCRGNW